MKWMALLSLVFVVQAQAEPAKLPELKAKLSDYLQAADLSAGAVDQVESAVDEIASKQGWWVADGWLLTETYQNDLGNNHYEAMTLVYCSYPQGSLEDYPSEERLQKDCALITFNFVFQDKGGGGAVYLDGYKRASTGDSESDGLGVTEISDRTRIGSNMSLKQKRADCLFIGRAAKASALGRYFEASPLTSEQDAEIAATCEVLNK